MARAFGQRPSSLLDLGEHPLVAYAVDEALFVLLRASDAERGGDGRHAPETARGAPPKIEDLIGIPTVGEDGVSRYLDERNPNSAYRNN